jgi:hypothetical protein
MSAPQLVAESLQLGRKKPLETKPGAPVVGDQAVGGLGIPIVMLSLPGSPAASTRESAANRARCRSTDAF